MRNKRRVTLTAVPLLALAMITQVGFSLEYTSYALDVEADEGQWRILVPSASGMMLSTRHVPSSFHADKSLPAEDYVSYMLTLGYSNEQITANLKKKGYHWPDDKGYWDVETPEPADKFVPEVPEWVGVDYRDLTPSPDSRERICWDDRPLPPGCYGDGEGYSYGRCWHADYSSERRADVKQFYENRCKNWDWNAYWIQYKADMDAGRRMTKEELSKFFEK